MITSALLYATEKYTYKYFVVLKTNTALSPNKSFLIKYSEEDTYLNKRFM